MRAERAAVAWSLVLLGAAACGESSEGESCDPANGNADCESGLVCTPAHAVKATEPVCCPRAPTAPSVEACRSEVGAGALPDPSIDASFAAGGRGAGGTGGFAGSGGIAGAVGSAGTEDSAIDAVTGDGSPDASGTDTGSDSALDSAEGG